MKNGGVIVMRKSTITEDKKRSGGMEFYLKRMILIV